MRDRDAERKRILSGFAQQIAQAADPENGSWVNLTGVYDATLEALGRLESSTEDPAQEITAYDIDYGRREISFYIMETIRSMPYRCVIRLSEDSVRYFAKRLP